MIIVDLLGGLGNQLFQYAAGLALCEKHQVTLKVDLQRLKNYHLTYREYELVHLDQPPSITQFWDVLPYRYHLLGSLTRFALQRHYPDRQYLDYHEPHYHYDPDFESLPSHTRLRGYFTSQKYFQAYEQLIREKLTFKPFEKTKNKSLAMDIKNATAVSLHVRRGDYLANPKFRNYHGLLSLEYYKKALRQIRKKLSSFVVFVFSDDPDWVEQHIKTDQPTVYVNHNQGSASFRDMQLMSLCDHHIIANSTFSWWGAWLNPSKDKKVIAPKQWFQVTDKNTKDLLPKNWVRI